MQVHEVCKLHALARVSGSPALGGDVENCKLDLAIFDCDGVLVDSELLANKDNMKFRTLFLITSIFITSASLMVRKIEKPNGLTPTNVYFQEVVNGLNNPVGIVNARDGSGRLFIVEKAGKIKIIQDGILLSAPFLDIQSLIKPGAANEEGLLALTFHPNFIVNKEFYVVYTAQKMGDTGGSNLILKKYTVSAANPNQADSSSEVVIMTVPHPTYSNHNGSDLTFGNDGYLYWSVGDGGGAGDPNNNGQNLYSYLGKILRIDVDGNAPYEIPTSNPFYGRQDQSIKKEIWAYGLRNPWRFSFDRITQDIYIGDVGQGSREEINFQQANSTGGENYGWRVMEGSICYNLSNGCDQSGKVLPIAEYDHSDGCSVTGGYVYRGLNSPSLNGYYFYGDYCSGRIFATIKDHQSGWSTPIQLADTPYNISTFGEDEKGELYFADYAAGKLYNIHYKENNSARFAIIGDYGAAGRPELDVANRVNSWLPDFIITTGDNNYPLGESTTIDANIGQYYRQFIYPYPGSYGAGATTNNFYPTLGNHDWITKVNQLPQPYTNYFSLPGNERYYDYIRGPVHFFVIDSDPSEPDGITYNSIQGQWLQTALGASTSPWNIVYLHHSPFSSGLHGSNITLQWPFQAWGVDIVFSGHDHDYERISINSFPYIVNGLGGYPTIYNFSTPITGSQIRYNSDYGAIIANATNDYINFKFINRLGSIIDTFSLGSSPAVTVSNIVREDLSPTSARYVDFTVSFSGYVTGVDADGSDFALSTSGITGASIVGVKYISPTTYKIIVNTGSGSGALRLDIPSSATITNNAGNPLSNLPFTIGESYTLTEPDLIITNVMINPPQPKNFPFDVSITIKNQGESTGQVIIYRDIYFGVDPLTLIDPDTGCPTPGIFSRHDTYTDLAPGQTDTKIITVNKGISAGLYQLWAYVDSRCLVREAGENNPYP